MAKKGPFWPFLTDFEPWVRHLRPLFVAATLSFLLQICVIVPHPHIYHPPKFQRNPKYHNRVVIFAHFAPARLLLAACCYCLLLAKPGMSTLDTKEGYKTKTGSTSSVTPTLTLTCIIPHGAGILSRPVDG